MRRQQQRTLARMQSKPTPPDIRWDEVVSLLVALGVDVVEREGSRVALRRGTERAIFHAPHPRRVVGRATVRDIVAFIECTGGTGNA